MYSTNPTYLHAPSDALGVRRMGPQNWPKQEYSANAPLNLHGHGMMHGLRGGELNGVAYGNLGFAHSDGGAKSIAVFGIAGLVVGAVGFFAIKKIRGK